ncbi:MAG: TonB-dependent receptor, partial [Bacteroidota bacterium]
MTVSFTLSTRLWSLIGLLLFCNSVFAGEEAHLGGITGQVSDMVTGEGLPAAAVQIRAARMGTTTDAQGQFHIHGLSPGNHWVTVGYLGYETDSVIVEVRENEVVKLDIGLRETALSLAGLQISAVPDNPLAYLESVDLALRPVQNAQELLERVPGLRIAQHAGGGKAEQIFLRGFDLDHGTDIALSVDGMPVNMVSHAHGQGYADMHFVIPEVLAVFEVRKGPYDAQDGNLATAGAVNLKTKDEIGGSRVQLSGGSFGTWRGLAMVDLLGNQGQKKKGLKGDKNAYVVGEYLFSRGYFDAPQDLERFNAFAKFSQKTSENGRLAVSLSAFQSQWDASGQIPMRAVEQGLISRFGAIDSTEGGSTRRFNANIEHSRDLSSQDRFTQQVYATYYDFDLLSNFTFFLE